MIDDVVAKTDSGLDSVKMNSYLNTKTNLKKLQYGVDKCQKLHVGCARSTCPDLYADEWKLQKVKKSVLNIRNLIDVEDGIHQMEETDGTKYLGEIICVKGGNKKNIAARRGRGIVIVKY